MATAIKKPFASGAEKLKSLDAKTKKNLMTAGGVLVALLIARFAYVSFAYVTTDNAMVQAKATLLSSRVSGIIVRSNVEENQKVKAGQVLAELRPDDYENALAEAEADLASLEAQTRAARLSYDRAQQLSRSGAATRERLDTTEAQFKSLDSRLKAGHARVIQAKLNLEDTRVKAPADGSVGRKSFEVGMLANAGQPLVGFVAGNERWVVANFKETELDLIEPGKRAYVTVDAIGREFEGEVESISPSTGATFSLLPPDNATGNFTKVVQRVPVRIRLLNLSEKDLDKLQAGLSAEVRVKVRW
jgi:membrane fusion protein (multidrug efflux system)